MYRIIECKLKKKLKASITHTAPTITVKLFFQSQYKMRTRTLKFTVCLRSRSGTEIDMLFVKTDPNTGPISQVFCYIQVIRFNLLPPG